MLADVNVNLGMLKTGTLTLKKTMSTSKKSVILVNPSTLVDISFLNESINGNQQDAYLDASSQLSIRQERTDATMKTQRSVILIGELTLAALTNTPLLILDQPTRTFIPFSMIHTIQDEIDLGIACNFQVSSSCGEYRFASDTSTDYQSWIRAIKYAFDCSRGKESPFTPIPSFSAASSILSFRPEVSFIHLIVMQGTAFAKESSVNQWKDLSTAVSWGTSSNSTTKNEYRLAQTFH